MNHQQSSHFVGSPLYPVINDQSFILVNFESLFLLSPSEIKRKHCNILTRMSEGTHRYKVPGMGKNGKLNEMIEVSALWPRGGHPIESWE